MSDKLNPISYGEPKYRGDIDEAMASAVCTIQARGIAVSSDLGYGDEYRIVCGQWNYQTEMYQPGDLSHESFYIAFSLDRDIDGDEFHIYKIERDTHHWQEDTSWLTTAGWNSLKPISLGTYALPYRYWYLATCDGSNINCNLPIFANVLDLADWIDSDFTDNSKILNYQSEEEEDEGDLWYIYNTGVRETWNTAGQLTHQGSQEYYRYVRFKVPIGSKVSLYDIEGIDEETLKCAINFDQEPFFIEKSTDGYTWSEVDTFPFEWFYRTRKNEVGTFYAQPGEKIPTYLPKWDNLEDAEDYKAGNKNITDAPNWGDISGYYPPNNQTGEDETETEFGEVYTRGFFSQQYILGESALQDVANQFFQVSSSGWFDDLKKGLEMYNNPIDSVMSLAFYPVNLTSIFSGTSPDTHVWFGGYQMELNHSVNKIIYPNGHIDIGTMTILPQYHSWRDYEPYCKLSIYLPYVGQYPLDLKKYYNKNVSVRYYIDTRTNGCCVVLIADGKMIDYFNGQMGVTMPITLTDFSAYATTQINTLLGGTSGIASGAVGAVTSGISQNYGGVVGGVLKVGAGTALTSHNLQANSMDKFNKTVGTSSAMINEYLPQYVQFIFEYMDCEETENLQQLAGKPSNASGIVGSFSGYLECDSVKLTCANATEDEKQEIMSLLYSGIYI